MRTRILILGGSTEARLLAKQLAPRDDLDVTLSLAGRTKNPVPQPVPTRIGGFGGVEGLSDYLTEQKIAVIIDATHPFAAGISANAVLAARRAHIDCLAIRRPQWEPVASDQWREAASVLEAIQLAGKEARHIFVALGRQELGPILEAPFHHYVIRSVDPIAPPLDLPDVSYILARGPFEEAAEIELLRQHNIDLIIAKNSGGSATYGKLQAARELRIPVILISRPSYVEENDISSVESVAEALEKLDHLLAPKKRRGV